MRKARKCQQGFTLIEVMMSMLIFMIALLGLVALQKASIAGTNKGREHTAAVNIARFAMARLEAEAASWTLSESEPPESDLPMIAQAIDTNQWWKLPDGAGGAVADAFRMDAYLQHSEREFYGGSETAPAPYCVHYMVSSIGPNRELLQVRVRVTWPKWKQYIIEEDGAGTWNSCNWSGWNDPSALEVRLKYSELVELTGVVTREYTSKMAQ